MIISDNQTKVQIFVKTKILGMPAEVVLRTTILPESDPTGTTFQERFEGIELGGMELPSPIAGDRAGRLSLRIWTTQC